MNSGLKINLVGLYSEIGHIEMSCFVLKMDGKSS